MIFEFLNSTANKHYAPSTLHYLYFLKGTSEKSDISAHIHIDGTLLSTGPARVAQW